ncbi:hypothetical protein BDW59DRAFT_180377 [Aspergillus cavernicola]|uniref:Tse2 ADP-ribosyltransferase toxin domain-containing protein n=1 Tax=Aspergillus cavernicola TaxID=176166 RepID=A0ABR4I8N1_9EURO
MATGEIYSWINLLRPISSPSGCRTADGLHSSHSIFPATMHQFQLCPETIPFDKKKFDRDDLEWEDGIEVASDGLVHAKRYPNDSNGGALFMPNALALYREQGARRTLQPSQRMFLQALNKALTDFYTTSSTLTPSEEWLHTHPYNEALLEDSEERMKC